MSTMTPSTHAERTTSPHWEQIYAKAWLDDEFRTLLETDPDSAVEQFAAEHGLQSDVLLASRPQAPGSAEQDEHCIHLVSCC